MSVNAAPKVAYAVGPDGRVDSTSMGPAVSHTPAVACAAGAVATSATETTAIAASALPNNRTLAIDARRKGESMFSLQSSCLLVGVGRCRRDRLDETMPVNTERTCSIKLSFFIAQPSP